VREYSLEKEIKAAPWLVHKIRSNKVYAQNLYAALCNNKFVKNEVWPILTEKDWYCSWRAAGGIIAEIRMEGDYMDWYCSGPPAPEETTPAEDVEFLTEEEREVYDIRKNYVRESVVVDEIRNDLLQLGWIVIPHESTD
jgi:hypothetical protein